MAFPLYDLRYDLREQVNERLRSLNFSVEAHPVKPCFVVKDGLGGVVNLCYEDDTCFMVFESFALIGRTHRRLMEQVEMVLTEVAGK